jgi:hypothetical protein
MIKVNEQMQEQILLPSVSSSPINLETAAHKKFQVTEPWDAFIPLFTHLLYCTASDSAFHCPQQCLVTILRREICGRRLFLYS